MKNPFQLQGCTALITGASAGLGSEFARQLASKAGRLILVGRREDRLELLADSLKQNFPVLKVDAWKIDLTLSSEREQLARRIIREEIPLNLLINNAGLGDLGSFEDSQWERLFPVMEVNVVALTHLTHLLLPMLETQSPSGILNVSSVAGFFPLPEMAVYAATKSYVTALSEALQMELAPKGISVTALCPGPVPTEFFKVASRHGETIGAMDRTHPSLVTSPELVVREALCGLEKDQPVVVPNRLLSLLVSGARLIPFPWIRTMIRLGAGPQRPKSEKMPQ